MCPIEISNLKFQIRTDNPLKPAPSSVSGIHPGTQSGTSELPLILLCLTHTMPSANPLNFIFKRYPEAGEFSQALLLTLYSKPPSHLPHLVKHLLVQWCWTVPLMPTVSYSVRIHILEWSLPLESE